MNETTKSNKRRAKNPQFWNKVLRGYCIDIGCSTDPLKAGTFGIEKVRTFDRIDGDANNITRYVKEQFDTVYASQLLEHLYCPPGSLFVFWSLVKPGGHLVITVPDADLYEQKQWPSRWNTDHKWLFTLDGADWNERIIHFGPLLQMLPNSDVLWCKRIDTNYDHSKKDVDQTLGDAEAWLEGVVKKHE